MGNRQRFAIVLVGISVHLKFTSEQSNIPAHHRQRAAKKAHPEEHHTPHGFYVMCVAISTLGQFELCALTAQ